MQTILPEEAIQLARQRATAFEQTGEVDPSDYVDQLVREIQSVLDHPSLKRSEYLAALAAKAKMEIAVLDPALKGARRAFFSDYLERLQKLPVEN